MEAEQRKREMEQRKREMELRAREMELRERQMEIDRRRITVTFQFTAGDSASQELMNLIGLIRSSSAFTQGAQYMLERNQANRHRERRLY